MVIASTTDAKKEVIMAIISNTIFIKISLNRKFACKGLSLLVGLAPFGFVLTWLNFTRHICNRVKKVVSSGNEWVEVIQWT